MGLNLVIGCHECRQKVWLYRNEASPAIDSFYRAHWAHYERIDIGNDQGSRAWEWDDDYEDVGEEHGVVHDPPPRVPDSAWVGLKFPCP